MKKKLFGALCLLSICMITYTSCEKEPVEPEEEVEDASPKDSNEVEVVLAKISSAKILDIKKDIATCEITVKLGTNKIEKVGVCWDRQVNGVPTLHGNANDVEVKSNQTSYSVELSDMKTEEQYTARAFIVTEGETIYSNSIYFTSGKYFEPGNGAVDRDGNQYQTVIIGSQEWFAADLKTTRYRDGTSITSQRDYAWWGWVSDDTPYRYSVTNGMLYNHYVLQKGKALCPSGWHVPSRSEWNTLVGYVDPDYNKNDRNQSMSGDELNANYNLDIIYPGYISPFGGQGFERSGSLAAYWTTSAGSESDKYWATRVYKNRNEIESIEAYEKHGYCIRCLKDQ